jgi:hypothetical protein
LLAQPVLLVLMQLTLFAFLAAPQIFQAKAFVCGFSIILGRDLIRLEGVPTRWVGL